MTVQTRRIGRSDLDVPPVGVGTWQWGDRRYWGYGGRYGERDIAEAFDAATGAGLTFFDTAEIYAQGESERLLGDQLRRTGAKVIVATKYMPFPQRWTRRSVQRALDDSLRRLGIDAVDLYQIHWPFSVLRQPALLEALTDAVRSGKVRWAGVSNYGPKRVRRAHRLLAERGVPLVSNQIEYSLAHRGPEVTGLVDTCRELDITIIAYSPLAQGVLTGKYVPGTKPEGARRLSSRFSSSRLGVVQPLIAELRRIGEARGKTPAQVALNWLVRKEGVIAIPGTKNAEQARSSAGALGWEMDADEAARLDSLSGPWRKATFLDRVI